MRPSVTARGSVDEVVQGRELAAVQATAAGIGRGCLELTRAHLRLANAVEVVDAIYELTLATGMASSSQLPASDRYNDDSDCRLFVRRAMLAASMALFRVLSLLTCLGSAACFDLTREAYGQKDEDCYREKTCDSGFVCRASVCVQACGEGACGGHGACSYVDGEEQCACDPGYRDATGEFATCVGASTLRFLNASLGLGAVDVYLAGSSIASALGVAEGALALLSEFGPGGYRFDLRAAGAPASSTPLFTTSNLTVAANVGYDVVLSGALNPLAGERGLTARAYPMVAGGGRLIMHAAQAASVDIAADTVSIAGLQPLETRPFDPAPELIQVVVDISDESPTSARFVLESATLAMTDLVIFCGTAAATAGDRSGFFLLALRRFPAADLVRVTGEAVGPN